MTRSATEHGWRGVSTLHALASRKNRTVTLPHSGRCRKTPGSLTAPGLAVAPSPPGWPRPPHKPGKERQRSVSPAAGCRPTTCPASWHISGSWPHRPGNPRAGHRLGGCAGVSLTSLAPVSTLRKRPPRIPQRTTSPNHSPPRFAEPHRAADDCSRPREELHCYKGGSGLRLPEAPSEPDKSEAPCDS
jgi:hypothetical protein